MSDTQKIKELEAKLTQAIDAADEMAAKMRGQIQRQKAGLDRLIAERAKVIELLQQASQAESRVLVDKKVREALAVMHVKPKS